MEAGSFRLAAYMRENWKTNRFWLNHTFRKSWPFDCVYLKYLDGGFFGERDDKIPME